MPNRSALRALWSVCSAVFTVGSAHAATSPVVAGPFEIHLVPARIGAGGYPNTTMNPFRTTTISQFRVKHRGKPVTVVDGPNTIGEFAEVRILDGAPRPTLLVAYAGVYVVYAVLPTTEVCACPGSTICPAEDASLALIIAKCVRPARRVVSAAFRIV